MLTRAQLETFNEDGFLIVKGLIPEQERIELLEALDRVICKVNSHPSKFRARCTLKKDNEWDTWGVGDVFCPDLYERAFDDYLGSDKILDTVGSILGRNMRFWGGHALWSPEKVDYNLHWHRDGKPYLYNPTGLTTHVQFNSALTQDHCFIAVPGSHRRPLTDLEMSQFQTGGTDELPDQVIAQCEPGDVLFMNAWTFHRGASPIGGGRRTLHFNLQPAHERYGGQSSRRWMHDPSYLNKINPNVRQLMKRLIEWEDAHPMIRDDKESLYSK